jgi:hypothetical protein
MTSAALAKRPTGERKPTTPEPFPDLKEPTMHKPRPTLTRRAVAVLILTLLAAPLTGCGIGSATKQEKVSKTVTTYLRALADGDTAKACTQLTNRAKGERCQQRIKQRLTRLDPDALKDAADGSTDIDVHGDTATARLSQPDGARFLLVRAGTDWRIDSGYTLD